MPAPGIVLAGRFEIERLVAARLMGSVWRARDLETGAPVAVKVLDHLGEDEAARFACEGEALASISHPAVLRMLARGRSDADEPFLVAEWLDGEDLTTRLRRGPLDVRETVALGARIAAGLGAAHRVGVVHRDVKPSNVWLCGGRVEEAKLIDFGIAHTPGTRGYIGDPGALLGTPGWIAPEQAEGADADPRADVFSLGAVLYRCLAGRPPFGGPTATAALLALAQGPAPELDQACPTAPPALVALVARMLDRAPNRRPADGDAVAAALAAIDPSARGPGPAAVLP